MQPGVWGRTVSLPLGPDQSPGGGYGANPPIIFDVLAFETSQTLFKIYSPYTLPCFQFTEKTLNYGFDLCFKYLKVYYSNISIMKYIWSRG